MLNGALTLVNSNEAVRLGMTRGQFEMEYFLDAGGFGFSFDSFRKTMPFSWQDIVARSTDLMSFGRKFEGERPYDKLFYLKSNPKYAHHVFYQLSNKRRGDSTAVSAADRTLSLEEKSEFAELILDVFDRVLFAPEDWHTGMNMMQSIYSIYCHLLLKHTQSWLKIARLSKDIRSCYYKAHKLVMFCKQEFTRYL